MIIYHFIPRFPSVSNFLSLESFPLQRRQNESSYKTNIDVKKEASSAAGADPARVHWVHVHPLVSEYMFIVCSMLEAPWMFRQIKGTLSIL